MVCESEIVRFKWFFVFVKKGFKKAFFSTLFKKDVTEGEQSSARLGKFGFKKLKTFFKILTVEQHKEMVCGLHQTKVGKKSCCTVNR